MEAATDPPQILADWTASVSPPGQASETSEQLVDIAEGVLVERCRWARVCGQTEGSIFLKEGMVAI